MNSAVCCVCGSNTDLKYISNGDVPLPENLELCATIKRGLIGTYSKHICNKCEIDLKLSRRNQEQYAESKMKREHESYEEDECEDFFKEDELCDDIKIEETQLMPAIIDYPEYEPSNVAEQQHAESTVGIKDKSQLHKCVYCERLCESKKGLNIHISKQHENVNTIRKHKCPHCEFSSSYKKGLAHHITVKHEKQAKDADYEQKSHKENKDHEAVSGEKTKQHKCTHCERSYCDRFTLWHHIKRQHETYENLYKCTYCTRSYVHKSKLIKHVKDRHRQFEPCACDICAEHFSQADLLETHMKSHEYIEYSTAFICNMCGEMFNAQSPLDNHMKMHILGKNRVEIIAGKSLNEDDAETQHKKPRSLRRKNNWKHEFSTSFICDVCEEMLISQSSLENHMENIHTMKVKHVEKEADKKKGPFRCEYCSKISLIRSAHISHIQRHTNERPYKCNRCNKQFVRLSDMERHVQAHNDDGQFKCQVCLKRFRSFGYLKQHALRHQGKYQYHCYVCNKGFFGNNEVMLHAKTHSGHQSYKCSTCEEIFETLIILKRHAIKIHGSPIFSADDKTHSGHSLYQCVACKKSYSSAISLKRHAFEVHGILNISTVNAEDEQKYHNKAKQNEDEAMSEVKVVAQLEKTKNEVLNNEDNIAKENCAGEEFISIKQEDEEFLEEDIPQTKGNEMQQNDVQIISRKIVKIN